MKTDTEHSSTPVVVDSRDADDMLLEFVRERDHPCPRCGYNLRNLTTPTCPECEEQLLLKVGVAKLKLHCFLLSVAPGMFCLIAFGIFCIMMFRFGPPGPMDLEGALILLFLASSGIFTIILASRYRQFLCLQDQTQALWMIMIWLVHIMVFGLFMTYI
jgi:hypothetical protein